MMKTDVRNNRCSPLAKSRFANIFYLFIISLAIGLFSFSTKAFAWVSMQIEPAYVEADGKSKVDVTVTVINPGDWSVAPYIDPYPMKGEKIVFSIVLPGEGSIKPETKTTDKHGEATVTFYAGTKTEIVTILAVDAKIGQSADGFVYVGMKVKMIKAEDGEADPPEYIGVGNITKFKAKVLPVGLTGEFKWQITKGQQYAQITAGADSQTVSVKGIKPSVTGESHPQIEKVKLKLLFKPTDAPDWFNVDEHEFVVFGVEVTGPHNTIEGSNSGQFSIVVEPVSMAVSSYQWIWKTPVGAGNNPQVNFATPDQETTVVNNARWFAFPDNRLVSVTGWDCKYTINCNVVIDGSTLNDITPPVWVVYLPVPPAATSFPQIAGMIQISQRQVGDPSYTKWYVSGMGTLYRTAPQILPYIPKTSQFYNKIVTVHEGRHVKQLTPPGVPGIQDHLLWDAQALYDNVLKGLTSTISENDLKNKVSSKITLRNMFDLATATSPKRTQAAEADAFAVSNAVDPDYLEFDVNWP